MIRKILLISAAAAAAVLVTGCLADIGFRNNAADPDGVYYIFEKNYPWIEGNSGTSFKVTFKFKKNPGAAFYCVVLPEGAAEPSTNEVKAGTGAGGSVPFAKGSFVVTADKATNETNVLIKGISSTTIYYAYCVSAVADKYISSVKKLRVNYTTLGWAGRGISPAVDGWHPVGSPESPSSGSGLTQFYNPRSMAIDGQGNIYVTDTGIHRIQKFTSNWTFITNWGTNGSGDSNFNEPYIAIDTNNNYIYVADRYNNRVKKYTNDGYLGLEGWWGMGSDGTNGWHDPGNGTAVASNELGMFNNPIAIAVDAKGNVFVADYNNHRVQMFDSNGTYLNYYGGYGALDGQLNGPAGLAVDNEYLYVTDLGNDRLTRFRIETGAYVSKIGGGASAALGLFSDPRGVFVDNTGTIYVADYNNNRVQLFAPNNKFRMSIGIGVTYGGQDGQFRNPIGVAADKNGLIYAVDLNSHRVQVFK